MLDLRVAGVHLPGRAGPINGVGGDREQNPCHRRRGHVTAEAGLLQHHRHHHLGIVAEAAFGPAGRAERREPGEVGLALLLRGARLSRHGPCAQREVDASLSRKIEGLVGRPPQQGLAAGAARKVVGSHTVHPIEQGRRDLGSPFQLTQQPGAELLEDLPVAVGDPGRDVRLVELPVAGQDRVGVGNLQRRGQKVALADRQVDGVSCEPLVAAAQEDALLELVVVVLPVGHHSGALVRQRNAGIGTQPERPGRLLDSLVEWLPPTEEALASQPVEVRVARHRDGISQIDAAVTAVRALEQARIGFLHAEGIAIRPGVVVELVRLDQRGGIDSDHPLRESCVGRHHLERRAGRIEALDGPVEDRREVLLSGQLVELTLRDAVHELAGVISWERCHGQDRAVPGVERHGCTRRSHEVGRAGSVGLL